MNARTKRPRTPLWMCPKCGMDSGERKVQEGPYERYYVVCGTCGYFAGPCSDMSHAVRKWNVRNDEKKN